MRTQSKTHNRQKEQVASVLLVPGFVSTCSRLPHLGQRGGRDAGSNAGTRLAMITRTHDGPAAQPGWPSERAAPGAIIGLSDSPRPTATGIQGEGGRGMRTRMEQGHVTGERERRQRQLETWAQRGAAKETEYEDMQSVRDRNLLKPGQQTEGQNWGGVERMVIEGETWVREKEGQGRVETEDTVPLPCGSHIWSPQAPARTLSTQVRAGTQGSAFGGPAAGRMGCSL